MLAIQAYRGQDTQDRRIACYVWLWILSSKGLMFFFGFQSFITDTFFILPAAASIRLTHWNHSSRRHSVRLFHGSWWYLNICTYGPVLLSGRQIPQWMWFRTYCEFALLWRSLVDPSEIMVEISSSKSICLCYWTSFAFQIWTPLGRELRIEGSGGKRCTSIFERNAI